MSNCFCTYIILGFDYHSLTDHIPGIPYDVKDAITDHKANTPETLKLILDESHSFDRYEQILNENNI